MCIVDAINKKRPSGGRVHRTTGSYSPDGWPHFTGQVVLAKRNMHNADYDKVGDEIHRLRDQKQKLLLENANRDELKKRMADMSTFLKKQSTALAEYDEKLVRRLIEKVSIHEDKFTVEFKSGVTVDVNE